MCPSMITFYDLRIMMQIDLGIIFPLIGDLRKYIPYGFQSGLLLIVAVNDDPG